jgi:hypothetical protein
MHIQIRSMMGREKTHFMVIAFYYEVTSATRAACRGISAACAKVPWGSLNFSAPKNFGWTERASVGNVGACRDAQAFRANAVRTRRKL